MKSLTTVVLTALSACVILAPALSHAAPATQSASVTVRYSDLNLATAAGNAALYARLVSAARQVCGSSDVRNLGELAAVQSCQKDAIAHAVQEVHSAQLAAVFAKRTGTG